MRRLTYILPGLALLAPSLWVSLAFAQAEAGDAGDDTTTEPASEAAVTGEEAAAEASVDDTESEASAETADDASADSAPADDAPAAPEEAAASPGDSDEELQARIDALEQGIADLELKREEAEMAALTEDAAAHAEADKFRIYGFMDMGVNSGWMKEVALARAAETDVFTFATGNINLYFDFTPHPDWRALAEIRFNSGPHGKLDISTDGTVTRTNSQQFDDHGTAANAPVWPGSTIIERAWIEWGKFQQFKVRTGNWFTPFGIWNVDHGSPTLISTALPQFMQQLYIPVRQTGVQVLGSTFIGNQELAYRAWLSNGRQELGNLDFNDDKAFGARIFLRKDGGKIPTKFGTSFHHGRVTNQRPSVAINSSGAITFPQQIDWAYRETIVGADISVDIHDTRIRTEGLMRLIKFEEDRRQGGDFFAPDGADQTDRWQYSAYLIVAHQLPWWGLEPFVFAEVLEDPSGLLPDGLITASGGLNIRFTASAMLKTQVQRNMFFEWTRDHPGEASDSDMTVLYSRLVLTF